MTIEVHEMSAEDKRRLPSGHASLYIAPHVATKIEPGAILYCSWGYDQTNIDFYYVTRCTKSSCWIVPMSSSMVEGSAGFMSENVLAGEPQWFSGWCECRHSESQHSSSFGCMYRDYDGSECGCRKVRPVLNVPKRHRIRVSTYDNRECITMTSYSSASLWGGGKLYASHYH